MIEMGMEDQQFLNSLFVDTEGIQLVLHDRGQVTHPPAEDQRARITFQKIDPRFFSPKIQESIADPACAAASHLVPTVHFP
jgi:hypothetical protein